MSIYTVLILLCALINVPFIIEGHAVNWLSFLFCLAMAWNSWRMDRLYR